MLRYILFILLIDLTIHAENVDVYSYSDSKKVSRIKRQFHIPPDKIKNKIENNEQFDIKNPVGKNNDLNNKNDVIGDKKVDDVPKNSSIPNKNEQNNVTQSNTIKVNTNDTDTHIWPEFPRGKDHLGAAMRSFWVFLGLSVIVVIYFTFRAFKTRPGAPPPATVRKYGVVGRRGDLEMLPLPLNEEEDDDTLFDAAQQHNNI